MRTSTADCVPDPARRVTWVPFSNVLLSALTDGSAPVILRWDAVAGTLTFERVEEPLS